MLLAFYLRDYKMHEHLIVSPHPKIMNPTNIDATSILLNRLQNAPKFNCVTTSKNMNLDWPILST